MRKFLNWKSSTNSKVKFLMKSRGKTAMICRIRVFYIDRCFPVNIAKVVKNIVNDCFWTWFIPSESNDTKNRHLFRDNNRRCIRNPVKHLRWSFLQKYLTVFNCWLFLQNFMLFVSQSYEYTLIKLNEILECCYLFRKKLGLQYQQIYF